MPSTYKAATIAEIEKALTFIPADIQRDDWVKIGAALYNELGQEGFNLFDDWSKSAPDKYNASDVRSSFNSAKQLTQINIGTLFFFARQYGYKAAAQTPQTSKQQIASMLRSVQEKNARIAAMKADIKARNEASERRFMHWINEYREADTDLTIDPYLKIKLNEYAPESLPLLRCYKKINDHLLFMPLLNIKGKGKGIQVIQHSDHHHSKKIYGKMKANFFPIGFALNDAVISGIKTYISEGLATGLTAIACGARSVVVAVCASNIPSVVKEIKANHKNIKLVGLADYDANNTGEKAMIDAGIEYVMPDFELYKNVVNTKGKPPSDFNDLLNIAGITETKAQLGLGENK